MNYCDADHDNVKYGCYGEPNHEGPHWSYTGDVIDKSGVSNGLWDWPNEADEVEVEVSAPEPVFSQAEVGILLTTLVPVEAFFPALRKKLELMQANG